MEIRRVRPEECAPLGELTVRAYRHLHGGESLGPYEDQLADVDARSRDSEVYVALADGALLGGVTYVPDAQRAMSEFDDPDAAGVRMLAVDPAAQGRGAGRALVATCVDRARAQRRSRVILHSTPVMTIAQSLYRSLGFTRADDLDEWIAEEPYSASSPLHLVAYTLTL